MEEESSPSDILDMTITEEMTKKRPRVELELELEGFPLEELTLEIQVKLIEILEASHREVALERSEQLIEVSKTLHAAYQNWIEGRRNKLEHPPDLFTLSLARLFLSPRFKLITGS